MSAARSEPPFPRPAAVALSQVGKCYYRRRHKVFLVREALNRLLGKKAEREEFWALRGVDFTITAGESVAVIGRNGAGKSTLLGLVAGTIYPTVGSVGVTGRVGALLELGAGFHPDLTGRENIYLNASLLGLRKPEVDALFDRIVDFSGLAEFIDVPLRTYSSGMQVRLGFSVTAHTDPEILLLDEVFAVGDQEFQEKCIVRIKEFKLRHKTMLFVGHGMEALRGICERAIWLEHGRVAADGPFEHVLNKYASHAHGTASDLR
jgi:ABC-type polysaccharide/polyol phosphate transport system ATPase subunit